MRRALTSLISAALVVFGSVPASAASPISRADVVELVADASAVAFALRPSYDAGGANPLHLYVGYADANFSSPEPAADGQGSWYQLNIVETAAFQPPENCTPQKNAQSTQDGLADVQAWLASYADAALGRVQDGEQPGAPTVPGPRHPCTERFSGFAQSRFPATDSIPQSATDNYLDKHLAAGACREDPASPQCRRYREQWPAARDGAYAVQDGSFAASSSEKGQVSESLLMGIGDATVAIGLSRMTTRTILEQRAPGHQPTLVTESISILDDICILGAEQGCTLKIDRMRHVARIERAVDGGAPAVTAQTTIVGVHGVGPAAGVTAEDLQAEQGSVDLGGYLRLDAVADTHSCDGPDGIPVADAGGLRLYGGGPTTTVGGSNGVPATNIPGGGGGIMIGGACARATAQVERYSVDTSGESGSGGGTPDQTLVIPGRRPAPSGSEVIDPGRAHPQVIARTVSRIELREPVAWRTAPYWGSILGALALAAASLYLFRGSALARPVIGRLDRFARQFLRG